MSTHSKAPWVFGIRGWNPETHTNAVIEKPFDYPSPGYYDNPFIFDADGNEVVGCDEYHVFSSPEDIRLLTAAPDLIHALEYMLAYQYDGDPRRQAECDMCSKARAAIAKAKGESQ